MEGYVRYQTNVLWMFLHQILREWVATGGALSKDVFNYVQGPAEGSHLSIEGRKDLISILERIAAAYGVDASGWKAGYIPGATSRGAETLLVGFKVAALVEIFSIGVLSSFVQNRYVWIDFPSIQDACLNGHEVGEDRIWIFEPDILHFSEWKGSLEPLNRAEGHLRNLVKPGCIHCGRAFSLTELINSNVHNDQIAYLDRYNGDSRWGYELCCRACFPNNSSTANN